MKRVLILTTLLLLAGLAGAERFASSTGSLVRIEGTSTLHAWKMEGAVIQGQITAPPLEQWQNGKAATNVAVAIPVTSIRSEHAKMDKLMAEALKAGANPEIRYQQTEAILGDSNGNTFAMTSRGKLTIAGVARDVELAVNGARDGNKYVLTAQVPIRMSDYGIKPPTAMMGTIRTGNDVKVTIRWTVEAR